MYPSIFSESSPQILQNFSNTYVGLMARFVQHNFEQAELMQEKFFRSVRLISPDEAKSGKSGKELEQEVAELKAQVERLNNKLATLDNRSKSGRWNRSGSGHFRAS